MIFLTIRYSEKHNGKTTVLKRFTIHYLSIHSIARLIIIEWAISVRDVLPYRYFLFLKVCVFDKETNQWHNLQTPLWPLRLVSFIQFIRCLLNRVKPQVVGINMKDQQHSTAIAFKTMKRKKPKISRIQCVDVTWRMFAFMAFEQLKRFDVFPWKGPFITIRPYMCMPWATGAWLAHSSMVKLIHPNCNWAN